MYFFLIHFFKEFFIWRATDWGQHFLVFTLFVRTLLLLDFFSFFFDWWINLLKSLVSFGCINKFDNFCSRYWSYTFAFGIWDLINDLFLLLSACDMLKWWKIIFFTFISVILLFGLFLTSSDHLSFLNTPSFNFSHCFFLINIYCRATFIECVILFWFVFERWNKYFFLRRNILLLHWYLFNFLPSHFLLALAHHSTHSFFLLSVNLFLEIYIKEPFPIRQLVSVWFKKILFDFACSFRFLLHK